MARLLINTMKNGDIYEDANGTKWAVSGYWSEPVVTMEQVWPPVSSEAPQRLTGGISGLMWDGFRKLSAEREDDAVG